MQTGGCPSNSFLPQQTSFPSESTKESLTEDTSKMREQALGEQGSSKGSHPKPTIVYNVVKGSFKISFVRNVSSSVGSALGLILWSCEFELAPEPCSVFPLGQEN